MTGVIGVSILGGAGCVGSRLSVSTGNGRNGFVSGATTTGSRRSGATGVGLAGRNTGGSTVGGDEGRIGIDGAAGRLNVVSGLPSLSTGTPAGSPIGMPLRASTTVLLPEGSPA